jgi:hypothetical protein
VKSCLLDSREICLEGISTPAVIAISEVTKSDLVIDLLKENDSVVGRVKAWIFSQATLREIGEICGVHRRLDLLQGRIRFHD